jgi:hypothetical protein
MEGDITFLWGQDRYSEYVTVVNADPEYQRLVFYSRKIGDVNYATRKITDTHVYWSVSQKTPHFYNNKLFYKHQNTSGITYDRKSKKLKVWFGQHIRSFDNDIIKDIAEYFNAEWYLEIEHSIKSLVNNTIFNHIINGKINCLEEICIAYLKTSPYKNRDIDINLFCDVFKNTDASPKGFSQWFVIAKDCNDLLNHLQKHGFATYQLEHVINKSSALNRKIDFSKKPNNILDFCEKYQNEIKNQIIIYEAIQD